MNSLPPKQRVHGRPVSLRELLQLVHADAPLPLLNRDNRRPGDLNSLRCGGLRHVRGITRNAEALSDFCGRNLLKRRHDCALTAHWATKDFAPSERTNA